MAKINELMHPEYVANITNWTRYRLCYEGGDEFISAYLKPFTLKEEAYDFATRKDMTYAPTYAAAMVDDVKNSIALRMCDVTRSKLPVSMRQPAEGKEGGIDGEGSSLNSFIATKILPELLAMGKVGIFVDNVDLPQNATKADVLGKHPYAYIYKAEDIRSWAYNKNKQLTALVLRSKVDVADPATGVITGTATIYSHFQLVEAGVTVAHYDADGEPFMDADHRPMTVMLPAIPFIIAKLPKSLMKDVCRHQIALLNLASSDLNYAIKSNFPFYVEQFDAAIEMAFMKRSEHTFSENSAAGSASEEAISKVHAVPIGGTDGRRYPMGAERPGFIHPSPKPIELSMKKQDAIIEEIRRLVNLSIMNLAPQHASEASKRYDDRSLEAGLAYIGLILQKTEYDIVNGWELYDESSDSDTQIKYPATYNLKSSEGRLDEAVKLISAIPKVASELARKEMMKQAIKLLLGAYKTDSELEPYYEQIDALEVVIVDPDVLTFDVENGLVSDALASKLRGYPSDQVEQARKDHAERLARLVIAQSEGASAARGVGEMASKPNTGAKAEKR